METSDVCRVCLQVKTNENGPEFVSIFEPDEDNDHLFTKIMKCAAVQITEDDGFPEEICTNCFKNLNIAYNFKQQCEKSDEAFNVFLKKNNDSIQTSENALISDSKSLLLENDIIIEIPPITDEFIVDTVGVQQEIKRKRGRPKKGSKKKLESPLEDKVKVKLEDDFVYNSFEEDFIPEEIVPKKKKRGRPKHIYYDSNGQILTSKPKLLFVCDKCGKSFQSMVSLRGHQRRHTGEKPFMCSTCGKSFYVSNELKKHIHTHIGLKPYKCKYCDRMFTDWGSRSKHERCHRGERPYKCDLCPKSFSYSYVLKRHRISHSGIKEYSCELCKKDFTLRYHLTYHNRRYHSDPKAPDDKSDTELSTDLDTKTEHYNTNIIFEEIDETIEEDDVQNAIEQNDTDGDDVQNSTDQNDSDGDPNIIIEEIDGMIEEDDVQNAIEQNDTDGDDVQNSTDQNDTDVDPNIIIEEIDETIEEDDVQIATDQNDIDGDYVQNSTDQSDTDSDDDYSPVKNKFVKDKCSRSRIKKIKRTIKREDKSDDEI